MQYTYIYIYIHIISRTFPSKQFRDSRRFKDLQQVCQIQRHQFWHVLAAGFLTKTRISLSRPAWVGIEVRWSWGMIQPWSVAKSHLKRVAQNILKIYEAIPSRTAIHVFPIVIVTWVNYRPIDENPDLVQILEPLPVFTICKHGFDRPAARWASTTSSRMPRWMWSLPRTVHGGVASRKAVDLEEPCWNRLNFSKLKFT